MMIERKLHNNLLAVIIIFATAVALWSVNTLPDSERLVGDATSYDKLAMGMLEHTGYASVTRAPVYPLFVASVYAIAGHKPVAVAVTQALLCVLTLLVAHRIFLYVIRDRVIALVALAICALWPPFYKQIPVLLVEGFSCALTAVTIWSIICAVEKPSVRNCVSAGVLVTVLTLTKAVTIPYILLAPFALLIGHKDHLHRRGMVVMILASILALAPWTYRNYRVTDRFLPVTTMAGFNMWYGNSPDAFIYADQADWLKSRGEKVVVNTVDSGAVDRDRVWMRRGIALIMENPLRALGLFARKFSGLWLGTLGCNISACDSPIPHIGSFGIPKMAFIQVPLFVLAVMGWFMMDRSEKARAYPIVMLALIWTGAYVLLWGERRYMIPMTYYEILFAVTAVFQIARHRTPVPAGNKGLVTDQN